VRSEIQNLSFTPKETDIYRIHQSGDLANLDGLDDSSLELFPSLLVLRDALYSSEFRNYLSQITQAGPLSGRKTDMAVNVYTPGCHLLCHDDVIGSRRVSYILYLTDPDKPWKEEWGGALRLYPTSHPIAEDPSFKLPLPDPTLSIPPAFNQLSFFAVRPGESFHDVEEVFASKDDAMTEDETRVRMAISGWYHIPQEGEDGYVEGVEPETKSAKMSSLTQLQGKGDAYDLPAPKTQSFNNISSSFDSSTDRSEEKPLFITDPSLSEDDLNFLLKYIAPSYLTPDTLESVEKIFTEQCSLTLETFLSSKFSKSLRDYIVIQESQSLPASTREIESTTPWTVARPPHKHRFLFQQGRGEKNIKDQSPLQDLLENLLPSLPFYKWLQLATGQKISSHNLLARRFRRGKDYTLATRYDEEDSRLEITLAITPTLGWEAEKPAIDEGGEAKDHAESEEHTTSEAKEGTGSEAKDHAESKEHTTSEAKEGTGSEAKESTGSEAKEGTGSEAKEYTGGDVGGYVAYMGGEDDDEEDDEADVAADDGGKGPKSDPAVYRAAMEDDDSILFSMPASWNRLGIVLRDKGVMRFVKYVSQQAQGDRWDICGEFCVIPPADEEEAPHEEEVSGGQTLEPAFSDDTDETEQETETSDDDLSDRRLFSV
jgi:prolyl 3-hydroxylase /prolyl 3,4-dihydroxylase